MDMLYTFRQRLHLPLHCPIPAVPILSVLSVCDYINIFGKYVMTGFYNFIGKMRTNY